MPRFGAGTVLAYLSGAVALAVAALWAASDVASLTYRTGTRGPSLEVSSAEGRLWVKRAEAAESPASARGLVLDCPSCVVNEVYIERRAPGGDAARPRELAGFYFGAGGRTGARIIGIPLWSLVFVFSLWPGSRLLRAARKRYPHA
jgi:hypothetical protein